MTQSFEIQKAIYQAIVDTGLVGTRVYDEIPESDETEFPYVAIGESDGSPDDVECSEGTDDALTLQIWSRYQGFKEVKNIIDGLRPVLHNVSFTVPGRSDVNVWFDFERTFRDSNGVDRRGIVQLRIIHHG